MWHRTNEPLPCKVISSQTNNCTQLKINFNLLLSTLRPKKLLKGTQFLFCLVFDFSCHFWISKVASSFTTNCHYAPAIASIASVCATIITLIVSCQCPKQEQIGEKLRGDAWECACHVPVRAMWWLCSDSMDCPFPRLPDPELLGNLWDARFGGQSQQNCGRWKQSSCYWAFEIWFHLLVLCGCKDKAAWNRAAFIHWSILGRYVSLHL